MTIESARLRLLMIPFAAMALTVGCGEGNVLQSPTGPSGSAGSATFLTADGVEATAAAQTGDVDLLAKGGNGKGGDKEKDKSREDDPVTEAPDADRGRKPADAGGPGRSQDDRVVGFVTANAAGTLTVNGIAIVAAPDAIIRHGNRILTIADIEVGDHVQARGTMGATGLVAEEIKVQDTGHDNDDEAGAAAIEGTISGLAAATACPVTSFMIGTTKVTTSAATTFDDVTCATLANGARVKVEGTTQADGSILATKVEAQAGPDEITGTIFEFSGAASCPAATFKVGSTLSLSTTVTTTAATTFAGVTCATLANGARVEVEGTRQANGSIVAASIELK
jgi:hypothetical protein